MASGRKVGDARRKMDVHYESDRHDWGTPQRLFDELDREFHFTRDVCANRENFKVASYWDEGDNALKQSWEGVLWMNPPYGRGIGMWLKKAYQSRATATIVCLIPSRTDSRWWHNYVMRADEIRFTKGRYKFQGAKDGAPFPSAIVIFRRKGEASDGT